MVKLEEDGLQMTEIKTEKDDLDESFNLQNGSNFSLGDSIGMVCISSLEQTDNWMITQLGTKIGC